MTVSLVPSVAACVESVNQMSMHQMVMMMMVTMTRESLLMMMVIPATRATPFEKSR